MLGLDTEVRSSEPASDIAEEEEGASNRRMSRRGERDGNRFWRTDGGILSPSREKGTFSSGNLRANGDGGALLVSPGTRKGAGVEALNDGILSLGGLRGEMEAAGKLSPGIEALRGTWSSGNFRALSRRSSEDWHLWRSSGSPGRGLFWFHLSLSISGDEAMGEKKIEFQKKSENTWNGSFPVAEHTSSLGQHVDGFDLIRSGGVCCCAHSV